MYQTNMQEGMVAETVNVQGHKGDTINAYYARPSGAGPYPGTRSSRSPRTFRKNVNFAVGAELTSTRRIATDPPMLERCLGPRHSGE